MCDVGKVLNNVTEGVSNTVGNWTSPLMNTAGNAASGFMDTVSPVLTGATSAVEGVGDAGTHYMDTYNNMSPIQKAAIMYGGAYALSGAGAGAGGAAGSGAGVEAGAATTGGLEYGASEGLSPLVATDVGSYGGVTGVEAGAGGWSLADIGNYANKGYNWLTSKGEDGQGMSPAELGIGLYDMYAKNRMGEAQAQRFDTLNKQIDDFYAPGSPEYNLMKQEIERKDAAAGRLSQYGQREVDLAARIAPLKMNARVGAMQSQNALYNQSLMNQWGAPGTLASMYGNSTRPSATSTLNTVKNTVDTAKSIYNTGSDIYDWFTS